MPSHPEQDGQSAYRTPDLAAAPDTDRGTVPHLKFSFSDAHPRIEEGGWAREVTERELPIAKSLAGVNMRLVAGGVRELHWHKQAEWAFMLEGRARITAIDYDGRDFVDDVGVGDLWYFPAGIPHSIQGLESGCEFLLVFDSGSFSENNTFLITDWFAHTPKAVLAKNFGVGEHEFDAIPKHERYIFAASLPGPFGADKESGGRGVAVPFSFRLMNQQPIRTNGGLVRIADSTNFPVARTVAAALVELDPHALREMHWHPNAAEWQYYLQGHARMSVFAADGKARTFEYRAGDVGYVPFAMGHYIENIGEEPVRFLEMFNSDRFQDVSLRQWMALTPPQLVQEHLNLTPTVMQSLDKEKRPVVAGSGRS
jgi:oxalate decarboxylase